ncbi:MAG TPA: multiheme c-type cytochrome [Tepidisphaeraceae bacterium]|nr:multiheme c-type cytochrome [Tepidisphaeraceae bacterium]
MPFIVLSVLLLIGLGSLAQEKVGPQSHLAKLTQSDAKFQSANTCSAAKCHGAPEPAEGSGRPENEFLVWSEQDKHASAYETLKNELSTEIGKKLKIDNVVASDRCLNCHAVNVPENLRDAKFALREGVTCNGCHGPSEKWNEPHAEIGWTEKQREAAGSHEALLKKWGLFDTKPVIHRAQMCTSCHLSIDGDLVAAGHPQPTFELDSYSEAEPKHWRDPEGYFSAKLWAAGQVVSVRDAMRQLAERARSNASDDLVKGAYEQAMAHLAMLRHLLATKAVPGDAAALDAKADALKKAMPEGNKDALATNADATADLAAGLMPAVDAFDPDSNKAAVIQLLDAIASDTIASSTYGNSGMDQQALAIYALYGAYAKAEKPPAAEDVLKMISEKLFATGDTPLTPDQFSKNLAEVKEKLPK